MFFTLRNNGLQTPSAALRISGPDANTYLQGQFTQDVRISVGNFCYGLWLNQKGKVLADSYILRTLPDELLVFAPRTAPALLSERLEAYLIADEVEIEDCSNNWASAILWGNGAAQDWLPEGAKAPTGSAFIRVGEALIWETKLGAEPGYTLLCPTGALAEWLDHWRASGLAEVDHSTAERARLLARRPAVPDDIGPTDLPNEGGLDATAISYTKGCYLGQEVMSRLKNLGQVRRKLFRVRGPGEAPPHGTALYQGEQRVGELRSAARDGEGFLAFAMLSLVTLNPTEPLASAPDGAADIVIDHG